MEKIALLNWSTSTITDAISHHHHNIFHILNGNELTI